MQIGIAKATLQAHMATSFFPVKLEALGRIVHIWNISV